MILWSFLVGVLKVGRLPTMLLNHSLLLKGIHEEETNHTVFLNNNSNGNTQHPNIFCVNT